MSRRGHYRNFNVNELAEALTRNGWQPPVQPNNGFGFGNQMPNGNQLPGNLSALNGLLGNMGNGGLPAMNGMTVPQMPVMPNMMPNRQPFPQQATVPNSTLQPKPVTDTDLLKTLFRQIIKMLAKE